MNNQLLKVAAAAILTKTAQNFNNIAELQQMLAEINAVDPRLAAARRFASNRFAPDWAMERVRREERMNPMNNPQIRQLLKDQAERAFYEQMSGMLGRGQAISKERGVHYTPATFAQAFMSSLLNVNPIGHSRAWEPHGINQGSNFGSWAGRSLGAQINPLSHISNAVRGGRELLGPRGRGAVNSVPRANR